MASVSEILSLAAKFSSLRADGAELDVALAAANKAYLRACLDCELTGADATHVTTASATALAASSIAGTGVYRVQHLRLLSSQQLLPLQQVSRQELQDYRATDDSQSTPIMYSVGMVAGRPQVDFFPAIQSGDTIYMSYLAAPTPLATATSTAGTTAVSAMPDMFHHDIITNEVVASLLERDGKFEEAQMWRARSLEGMQRLEEYLGQMGGNANRAYIAPGVNVGKWPDRRSR